MECNCDSPSAAGSASVAAGKGKAQHRFSIGALPCGLVARARARSHGSVVGEVSSYVSAGSCPE
jgi:hypothetical protein